MNNPGQCLESVKCWHCSVALRINRVTSGTSVARGPEDKPKEQGPSRLEDQRLPKPGCRGDPSCSTTPGSAHWFFSQVGQPGRVCCRGLAAGIQLLPKSPQPHLPGGPRHHHVPPHNSYSPIPGTSPKSGFSTGSFHSKPGSSL